MRPSTGLGVNRGDESGCTGQCHSVSGSGARDKEKEKDSTECCGEGTAQQG